METWKLAGQNNPKLDTAVVVLVENQGKKSTKIGYFHPDQAWRDRHNCCIEGVIAWWKPPGVGTTNESIRWNFAHKLQPTRDGERTGRVSLEQQHVPLVSATYPTQVATLLANHQD